MTHWFSTALSKRTSQWQQNFSVLGKKISTNGFSSVASPPPSPDGRRFWLEWQRSFVLGKWKKCLRFPTLTPLINSFLDYWWENVFKWVHCCLQMHTYILVGTNTHQVALIITTKQTVPCILWDQIWLFWKGLGDKFPYKRSPKFWRHWAILKNVTFQV